MTKHTAREVIQSGNSRIEDAYILELVQEQPGISAVEWELITALERVARSRKIVGRLRHGVMRYYTPQYVEKYNL